MYVHISILCQLRGHRNKDIPVAMSIPCTQILFLNINFQFKNLEVFGEMTNLGLEQNELDTSHGAKEEVTNYFFKMMGMPWPGSSIG